VPRFQVFPLGREVRRATRLTFPLVVKSVNEEASLGLSQASLVTSAEKLAERVQFMHETFGVDVIVEEYVEGRELYVGIIGNKRLETYPLWELPFDQLPEHAPHIATAKVKWDLDYRKKYKIQTQAAEGLSDAQKNEIARICKRVYRVLKLSGYARVDLRLTDEGKIYVLEANPNPDLALDDDLALSAKAAGVEYTDLLQRILNLGMGYPAEWKKSEAEASA
jgi:D-alanine-D-alanine ligase